MLKWFWTRIRQWWTTSSIDRQPIAHQDRNAFKLMIPWALLHRLPLTQLPHINPKKANLFWSIQTFLIQNSFNLIGLCCESDWFRKGREPNISLTCWRFSLNFKHETIIKWNLVKFNEIQQKLICQISLSIIFCNSRNLWLANHESFIMKSFWIARWHGQVHTIKLVAAK